MRFGVMFACALFAAMVTNAESQDRGQARIVILRPKAHALSALSAVIEIDKQPVATLKNGQCTEIPLSSGTHEVSQHWKAGLFGNASLEQGSASITEEFADGQERFVALETRASSEWTKPAHRELEARYAWALSEITEAQAQEFELNCIHGKYPASE